jgi:hypothetical protein
MIEESDGKNPIRALGSSYGLGGQTIDIYRGLA